FYYHGTQFLDNGNFPIILWHAHEMIFGYSMAVAVGFLLTAVKNWTGHQTLRGYGLLLLGLFWLMARIMPFTDFPGALMIMALFDLLFDATVCIALLYPLVRSKQWKQLGIWSILLLMTTGNTLFYIGLIWKHPELTQIGLFFGLYLIIALIMLMGQRVMPFFIERGVGYPVVLMVRPWVNVSSVILMMFFIVAVVWDPISLITALVAIALAFLQVLQMIGWYTPGIWRKPLLW
ncbi:NnrS family protein, partial [Acidithiobacillus ferrooxidans]